MPRHNRIFIFIAALALILTACNISAASQPSEDPKAVFTAAALTVEAQLTQVAVENPDTPVPPTLTPQSLQGASPTPNFILPTATDEGCDKAKFIADVTVPDGTVFSSGDTFTKTWRLENNGTCTWTTGYALVFESGAPLGGISPIHLTADVAPGQRVDISVTMFAPATEGDYTGNWQLRNASNEDFAKVYVQINVSNAIFAVTSVQVFAPNAGLAADITVNKAGTVKYHWIIRENGQSDITTAIETIKFDQGGKKTISTSFTCPHSGNFKAFVYIDDPNHQEFGTATFSCP